MIQAEKFLGGFMKLNGNIFGLVLAGLVLLPGCLHVPRYNRQSMSFIDESCNYHEVKNGVAIRVKHLTENDKEEIFGESSKQLAQSKNSSIELIYLSLHNLTKNTYILPFSGIGIPMIPYKDVVRLMKTSTVGRIAGITALGYVGCLSPSLLMCGIWGMAAGAIVGFPIAAAGFGIGIFSLAHLIKYHSVVNDSIKMNKRIAYDIEKKTTIEGLILESGDKCEKLIFVKSSDYKPQFSVELLQRYHPQGTLIFDVDLLQNHYQ